MRKVTPGGKTDPYEGVTSIRDDNDLDSRIVYGGGAV